MTEWKQPSEHPEGKVLVAYWSQFFGKETLTYNIGFYDDPKDYRDGNGKGWCKWNGDIPIKVYAWMPLPELPPKDFHLTKDF